MFICFIGMDGSGKTTLAAKLVSRLKATGVDCRYVWSRYDPWLAKPLIILARFFFLDGKTMTQDYASYNRIRSSLFKKKVLSVLYLLVTLPDLILQNIVKIKVPLILGENLVVDRYIYDAIVDVAFDYQLGKTHVTKMLSFLFKFLPQPTLTLLLDVPEEVAFNRKKDIPHLDYLHGRRKSYLDIQKAFRIMTLDGTKDVTQLCEEIQQLFQERETDRS